MTATHWAKVEIRDSDNITAIDDYRMEKLTEYRNTGGMHGFFFVNPETGEIGDWDYEPEIDWSDFPQAD